MINKLTLEQTEKFIKAFNIAIKEFPEWRKGQTLFNMLKALHPELANSVRATPADPFHQDAKIPLFLETISEVPVHEILEKLKES